MVMHIEVIKQLQDNMHAAEQRLAHVPVNQWVILWGNSVLKTDGHKVSLLGPKIFHGAEDAMKDAAQRFAATVTELQYVDAVQAMPARKALLAMRKANCELLNVIPRI